jgi:predicted transcriptional regulator
MYRAYLSWTQLQKYVEILESREMICYDGMYYHTMPNGYKFLDLYDEIQTLLGLPVDPNQWRVEKKVEPSTQES